MPQPSLKLLTLVKGMPNLILNFPHLVQFLLILVQKHERIGHMKGYKPVQKSNETKIQKAKKLDKGNAATPSQNP